MLLNIINQLPGYIAWKDHQHQYLGCNRNLAALYSLSHPDKIIGMKDENLGELPEEILTFYHDCDQLALSGKTITLIHDAHDSNKTFLLKKQPLFDNQNKITGTIFQCNELEKNIITKLKKHDVRRESPFPKIYKVGDFENPFALSVRELECLFCVLRGMTAKYIAEVLQLSKRTIEFYIDNIKNKFGVSTRSELIILSIQHNYMNVIPPRFVNFNVEHLFS